MICRQWRNGHPRRPHTANKFTAKMLPLILCGLLAVGSVFGEGEKLDFSGVSGRLQVPNQVVWYPPPIIGGGGIGGIGGIGGGPASPEVDSSEHGVTPGRRATSCKCGWANRGKGRIVGGKIHGPNEYPFIAGVAHAHTPTRPHCGSAIVSPWHILTAAHCTEGAKSLVVTVGDYDRSGRAGPSTIIRVRKIYDHEQYDNRVIRHDISLLLLEKPITQSQIVGPACMPTGPINLVGKHVRFIGWGAMQYQGPMTTLPQKVDVRVVDMNTCSRAWPYHVLPRPATQICTHSRRKTPCQGDSGGPVVYLDPQTNRYTLVGLVSFGPMCQDDKPSIQTSVAAYLPWINKIIQATAPGQKTCS